MTDKYCVWEGYYQILNLCCLNCSDLDMRYIISSMTHLLLPSILKLFIFLDLLNSVEECKEKDSPIHVFFHIKNLQEYIFSNLKD